jgi:hypothetical protein
MDIIYTVLLNLTAEPELGISEGFLKEYLSRAFFIGELDYDMNDRLEYVIDSSRDSITGGLNDYLHTAAKTAISYIKV